MLDDLHRRLQESRAASVSAEDRQLLEEHTTFVREMEQELKADASHDVGHAVPQLEPGVKEENDNMPAAISKLQIELMVSSFAADFARVATLQITNSVGDARMHWLGINEGHHELSHEPDTNKDAVEKLIKINKWYCEQLAYLAQRLAETPEPGGARHRCSTTRSSSGPTSSAKATRTRSTTSRSSSSAAASISTWAARSDYKRQPHNRLLLSLAHGFGHRLENVRQPRLLRRRAARSTHIAPPI